DAARAGGTRGWPRGGHGVPRARAPCPLDRARVAPAYRPARPDPRPARGARPSDRRRSRVRRDHRSGASRLPARRRARLHRRARPRPAIHERAAYLMGGLDRAPQTPRRSARPGKPVTRLEFVGPPKPPHPRRAPGNPRRAPTPSGPPNPPTPRPAPPTPRPPPHTQAPPPPPHPAPRAIHTPPPPP